MTRFVKKIKGRAKKIGHSFKAYFRFKDSIKNYAYYIKNCRKNAHTQKRIVFLIIFPESWNSVKSIYIEAQKRNDIDTFIVAAPRNMSKYDSDVDIRGIQNDAYEFFIQNGIEAIKANSESEWFDIKDLQPDYVIYTRPYNPYYTESYRSYNVCLYAKVIYIPYGYNMLADELTVMPEDFVLSSHKVYLANKSEKEMADHWYPKYIKEARNRFEYLGFPRFDLLAKIEPKTDDSPFTIAWLPRWTTGEEYKNNKGTNFFIYYKDFLEYAGNHSDINLIFRPHPSMFPNFIERGLMTEEEVNNYKKQCEKCGNYVIDFNKDYLDTILKADVLVADYTSLIAEFLMTGKPIIYCDTVDRLNKEGKIICKNLYNGNSFSEIIKLIERIRNGTDEQRSVREKIKNELFPIECGNIGKTILDSIISS